MTGSDTETKPEPKPAPLPPDPALDDRFMINAVLDQLARQLRAAEFAAGTR